MSARTPAVVAVGNVVIDIHYAVSPLEFDTRDFAHGTYSHVSREELDRSLRGLEPAVRHDGGSSVNKARILSAMGVPVRIAGVIGEEAGPFLEWSADKTVQDRTVAGRPRTACSAHITERDRWAVITAPGAFSDFDQLDPAAVLSGAAPASILTVEAYLLNNAGWLTRLLETARDARMRVHFDLGAPPLIARHRRDLVHLVTDAVNVVSGTEEEFRALLDLEDGTTVHAEVIGRELAAELVVLKRGARGAEAAWISRGRSNTVSAVGSGRETTPPWSVGCGDVLDGVILAGLATGRPVEVILPVATAAATAASRHPFAAVGEVPPFPR